MSSVLINPVSPCEVHSYSCRSLMPLLVIEHLRLQRLDEGVTSRLSGESNAEGANSNIVHPSIDRDVER